MEQDSKIITDLIYLKNVKQLPGATRTEQDQSHTTSITMETWWDDRLMYICTQGRLKSHHSHTRVKRQEKTLFTQEREKDKDIIHRERHEVRLKSCRMENQIQNLRKWHR